MRRAICRNTQADRKKKKNKFPSNHAQQTVTMAAMNEENIKTNNQLHDTIAYHEETKNYSGYTTRSAALRHNGSPTRSLCLVSAAARSLRSVECCTHTHAREREKHRTHTHTPLHDNEASAVCVRYTTLTHTRTRRLLPACCVGYVRISYTNKQNKRTTQQRNFHARAKTIYNQPKLQKHLLALFGVRWFVSRFAVFAVAKA